MQKKLCLSLLYIYLSIFQNCLIRRYIWDVQKRMLFNNWQITVICTYIPPIFSAASGNLSSLKTGLKCKVLKSFLHFLNIYMGQLFILFVTIKEVTVIGKGNNYINYFFWEFKFDIILEEKNRLTSWFLQICLFTHIIVISKQQSFQNICPILFQLTVFLSNIIVTVRKFHHT